MDSLSEGSVAHFKEIKHRYEFFKMFCNKKYLSIYIYIYASIN